jgi:hypothetical protein
VASVADLTESELERALDAQPGLVERLKGGDPNAFTAMLEVLAGPGRDVTVHLQYTQITGMDALARLGYHPYEPTDPSTALAAVEASRRLVASAPGNPAVQMVLAHKPTGSGWGISREDFTAKYLSDLAD